MQLTHTGKKQPKSSKVPDAVVETTAKRIHDLIPDEYRKWALIHFAPSHNQGKKTSAWAGMQWAECGDYMNVVCGCGCTFVQRKKGGEIVISNAG